MFIVKNLNVSNLEKNLNKEFAAPSNNSTIDSFINQIANNLNLDPSKIGF